MTLANVVQSQGIEFSHIAQHILCSSITKHGVNHNQGFEHDLNNTRFGKDVGEEAGKPTMALGSLSRVLMALQTSETAPSSSYVAAMIGSIY